MLVVVRGPSRGLLLLDLAVGNVVVEPLAKLAGDPVLVGEQTQYAVLVTAEEPRHGDEPIVEPRQLAEQSFVAGERALHQHLTAALQERELIHQFERGTRGPLPARQGRGRELDQPGLRVEVVIDEAGDELVVVVDHPDGATGAEAAVTYVGDHVGHEPSDELVLVEDVAHQSSPPSPPPPSPPPPSPPPSPPSPPPPSPPPPSPPPSPP